jgi:hypothetical protein
VALQGHTDLHPRLAAELVRLKPDALVVSGRPWWAPLAAPVVAADLAARLDAALPLPSSFTIDAKFLHDRQRVLRPCWSRPAHRRETVIQIGPVRIILARTRGRLPRRGAWLRDRKAGRPWPLAVRPGGRDREKTNVWLRLVVPLLLLLAVMVCLFAGYTELPWFSQLPWYKQ